MAPLKSIDSAARLKFRWLRKTVVPISSEYFWGFEGFTTD